MPTGHCPLSSRLRTVFMCALVQASCLSALDHFRALVNLKMAGLAKCRAVFVASFDAPAFAMLRHV